MEGLPRFMNSSTRVPGGLSASTVSPFALLSGVDRCVSCEAPLSGNYCAQCGERRPDRSHLRISTFLHRTLEEVADFEHSKLIRTLRLLFLRPGYLTTEFLRGAVKPYLGPVKLYVTVFALSLFLYSIYRPAAIYDVRSFIARDPVGIWHKRITAIAQKRHATEEQVLFEVNARWQKYLYFSEIVYPLGLATGLALLYVRSRRYYVEHLIFALHTLAFTYLLGVIFWPIYAIFGMQVASVFAIVSIMSLVCAFSYILVAVRRVYGQGWTKSAGKALALCLTYIALKSVGTVTSLLIALSVTGRAS
jgi:hypothetical protein